MNLRESALAGAALLAVAIGAMLIAGANPIAGIAALAHGAFGGTRELSETLVQTTALLFPALGVALAFRAGLFNIGADGQLVIGGLCAGLLGVTLVAPGFVTIPLVLAAGAVGGALWAGIASTLATRFGGSLVIATLMLNVVALLLANYLVTGPFHAHGSLGAETVMLPQSTWLPVIIPGTRLGIALPLALLLALAIRFALARTVFGYELRAVGDAPQAAARAGIDLAKTATIAMLLSGGIAGVGGATLVAGVLHRFTVDLSPGYGFIAIAVALVGRLDPARIVLAAVAFGALQSGSLQMQAFAHVPKDVVAIVEGLAILALSAQPLVRRARRAV